MAIYSITLMISAGQTWKLCKKYTKI